MSSESALLAAVASRRLVRVELERCWWTCCARGWVERVEVQSYVGRVASCNAVEFLLLGDGAGALSFALTARLEDVLGVESLGKGRGVNDERRFSMGEEDAAREGQEPEPATAEEEAAKAAAEPPEPDPGVSPGEGSTSPVSEGTREAAEQAAREDAEAAQHAPSGADGGEE